MNGYFWYINNTWFIHDTGCVLGRYMCVTMITIIYVYIYKSEHVSLRFHNHDYNIQASSWNNNVVHCSLFIDNSSNVSFNNRWWFVYVRCDFVTWLNATFKYWTDIHLKYTLEQYSCMGLYKEVLKVQFPC